MQLLAVRGDVDHLLGHTQQQFLTGDRVLQSLIHADDHDFAERLFSTETGTGSDSFNVRLRHADGRIRCTWCEFTRSAGDDGVQRLSASFIDAKRIAQPRVDSSQMASLAAMMTNTDDYIYFKDRHHVFTCASQTLVGITHPSEHWTDLLGKTDYDVFAEEYADAYYRLEKKVFLGLPVARELQSMMSVAGQKGWVDNRKYPIHDDANNIIGLYGIARDVTELRRTEEALRTTEHFLRTIIDEIPDPIVLKDAEAKFLLCNRAVATLYNTTPDAMVGKDDGDFGVPAEMANFFRENVLSIMARGETQTVLEDSQDAVTGEVRRYRSIKKPLKDAQGNNQILVVAQDITDITQTQEMLYESEQRLQFVLEITHEGVWDWHLPSGRVLHNAQWYKILRYGPDEIDDTVESFAALIHPKDKEAVWRKLDALLQGETDSYHSEHRLVCKDQTVIWAQDRGRVVERDAQGKVVRVIGSFSDISAQKANQQQLEHIAHYDGLTDLPNRTLLADRMQQALVQARRRGTQLVIAYLDLDGFKTVNDLHGHDVGDRLLTVLATQFKSTLREGDTIARIGGDEFVAVFVDVVSVQSSIPLIQRLLDVASRPHSMDGLTLQVSVSIGISSFPQSAEADPDLLLRQADQAMYDAKIAGKNRYCVFNTEQDRSTRVRNESLERIRQGLAANEMVLYYQPKVNLRTGAVVGVEALVRWNHPVRGLLAPKTFLPEIEGLTLDLQLGNWVLQSALAQMESWMTLGIDLPVSVNMSAHHLQQPDFAQKLCTMLEAHPAVKRDRLELEVLETSALKDIDAVALIIRDCAAMGVGFALDDFGTGYSSLTYLKRLPAQLLKVDQSFVRDMLDDPDDLAILQGVLGLATAFHRQVIAEGAETAAHCDRLLQLGCDLAQGYGIAHPMPAHEIPSWLSTWSQACAAASLAKL